MFSWIYSFLFEFNVIIKLLSDELLGNGTVKAPFLSIGLETSFLFMVVRG